MNQPVRKFASMKAISDDYEEVNSWFRSCQKNGIPYITVKTKAKFADIHWDYINLSHEAEKSLRDNSKKIVDGLMSLYHKYANEKSSCRLTELVGEYQKIDIQKSEELASEIFDFIYSFIQKNENV